MNPQPNAVQAEAFRRVVAALASNCPADAEAVAAFELTLRGPTPPVWPTDPEVLRRVTKIRLVAGMTAVISAAHTAELLGLGSLIPFDQLCAILPFASGLRKQLGSATIMLLSPKP